MSLYGVLECSVAVLGLLVWAGLRVMSKHAFPLGLGMWLWLIYGCGVIFVIFCHAAGFGDPIRGWLLMFAMFVPYILGLAAIVHAVHSMVVTVVGREFVVDIAATIAVIFGAVIHHFGFGRGPWL